MRLGRFQLNHISDGSIRLDGGAVFGIVPRVLWERKMRPDDRNRVRLGLNCLLIRTPNEAILVDTGAGRKYSPKERDIYGVGEEPDIVARLANLGMEPGDVDLVINTHLHFDHCGGNTRWEGREVVSNFPNATYIVAREDYLTATRRNERTAVSYRPENWVPLQEAHQLRLVDGEQEIVPGVSLVHTPGHTPGHHSVKVQSGGETVFFLGDLCATTAHVPLPWIMGYDLFPLTTLETRKRIYSRAVAEKWLLLFDHDPHVVASFMSRREGRYVVEPVPWED